MKRISLSSIAGLDLLMLLFAAMPPANAALNPVVNWSWDGSTSSSPESNRVSNVPSVIDLDGDGSPEVVFVSAQSSDGLGGFLRVLAGTTGAEKFSITDSGTLLNGRASIATGDIDGDSRPEIIAVDSDKTHLVAFEHDGAFKWRSQVVEIVSRGAPALADLDGDGTPEIIIGRQVLNNDGTLRWTGTGGRGSSAGPLSAVSDVNLDGSPDIVAGNTIYDAAGTTLASSGMAPDGFSAIANFDEDDQAEIVLVGDGKALLLDHDFQAVWQVALPGGGTGGPPMVADLDGDGQVEVGVSSSSSYTVFEADGAIKWTTVINDYSSGRLGSSAFDFDGDGAMEVLHRDACFLRVFDGANGATLLEVEVASSTHLEYPFVADVDNDGSGEIVVTADDDVHASCPPGWAGFELGILVLGDSASSWRNSAAVWNQHTFHVTNVLADGTIPAAELPHWLEQGRNGFRASSRVTALGPDIRVEHPAGSELVSLSSTVDFGPIIEGESFPLEFILANVGTEDLTGIVGSIGGANQADFSLSTEPVGTVPAGGSTTFVVSFEPASSAMVLRSANLHLASNDADTNPFTVGLTGTVLRFDTDTDGDGLNDASEWQMALQGFDWQVSQSALVASLFDNANGAGLYTQQQVQALHAPLPLIGINPATGRLRLTMDWQIAPDLENYVDLPADGPRSSVWVNGEGDIELEYEPEDNAAFFRVEIK